MSKGTLSNIFHRDVLKSVFLTIPVPGGLPIPKKKY